jgi:hypothetical protein
MIPERLNPLLSLLKTPQKMAKESFEFQLTEEVAPDAIKLIENGISLQLTSRFNNNDILEEFILRAAMIIAGTMTQEQRETERKKFLREKIDGFLQELIDLQKSAQTILAGPIPYNGPVKIKNRQFKCDKELKQVRESLNKWRVKYLRQSTPLMRPDVVDMLGRLFEEYLPNEADSFIDEQIIKMLSPFAIHYQNRSIAARRRRDKSG